ncbi:MAG: class I SAM-dependent methyltransferase [Candidatus Electrothrix sp. GM3_4]|nr:class I SAM-dependent methyltransferase [Candidatus Electrothrix sp. GM3_4]
MNYAKESAREKGLNISYLCQDYLQLAEENAYDLVIMIFTDFGVLTSEQRSILLHNIQRALKSGGVFLFDVLNSTHTLEEPAATGWELAEKGFWRSGPYLALQTSFFYPEQQINLTQHLIIDETEKIEVYRFWMHTFSASDLAQLMTASGFCSACYEKILPDSELYSSNSVTFCIARK